MKTTVDIPDPLYRKAKIRAVETGRTLRDLVLTALRNELEDSRDQAEAGASYWANRKLNPEFARLRAEGAFRPQPGSRSIEESLDEVKADPSA